MLEKLKSVNGRLARRMGMYVILASTFITIFTSSIQIYTEFQREVSSVEVSLEQIKNTHLSNIASRVWVLDTKELETTLKSLLSLPAIQYVAVYENSVLLTSVGAETSSNVVSKQYPLIYLNNNQNNEIGKVIVQASLSEAYQDVIDRGIVILASNGVKTFIVAILILLIFYQLIARHLQNIAEFAENLDINSLDKRFEFNRKKNSENKLDELDLLRLSLASMQDNLLLATKDLQYSKMRINLLLDSTAEAIYGIDKEGCCTFVNKSCLTMLGYNNSEELLGKNMHELIHYHYKDGSPYHVDDCFIYKAFRQEKGTRVDDEVFWRKDGSQFPVEYWSHPIFEEGTCIGAVVAFLDISQRLSMHEAIVQREQDLAITLNSIGDAVIVTDEKGIVVRMNPIAEKLTGWSIGEAEGKLLQNIFPIIDATTRKPIDNPVEKVISSGEVIYLSNHTTLLSRNGVEYQIADSAAPIRNEEGGVKGMVLVFNDVTEQYNLREAAAKSKRDLQAIMDNSPSVIYVKDIDGHYVFINQKYEDLFGVTKEAVKGKTDFDIFSEDFAQEFQKNDAAVLSAEHAIESEESVPHGDEIRTYLSIKFPLYDENEKIYAVCGISTDTTDRRHQEEQLRRSQKMEALGNLTGGIAHDYNNMLGVVLGYTELLANEINEQPKLAKYASEIQRAGERGAKLTKSLLSFSRRKSSDATRISLNKLISNEQHMLEKTLTARIELVLELAKDLWPIKIDSSDMEDAILNLSINAMHAMDGNGKLTIRTRNEVVGEVDAKAMHLDPGDYVLISITDTGSGMSKEVKEKIFEPFYTTKGEKGTGLGLAQVYGFVERSKGIVKVYSEQDHGTQFAILFPRLMEASVVEVEAVGESDSTKMGGMETILLVDDEPALLKLTTEILSNEGYKTYSAEGGKAALDILANESIDLMLSDVIMPEMDGYQLTAIVQEKYPGIKIQLASGFSDDRHLSMVDNSLHENLLHKPYSAKTLLARLRDLLDN